MANQCHFILLHLFQLQETDHHSGEFANHYNVIKGEVVAVIVVTPQSVTINLQVLCWKKAEERVKRYSSTLSMIVLGVNRSSVH